MQKISLILLILIFSSLNIHAQIFNQSESQKKIDSTQLPVIDIKPSYIIARPGDSKFIQREIKVLNRGGSPLYIHGVKPSCGCGSGKVLASPIQPLSIGKILVSVNLDGLYEDKDEVEFVISSNAKNSPVSVKIKIVRDSTIQSKKQ